MRRFSWAVFLFIFSLSLEAKVPRVIYQKGNQYLVLEFLYDGMTRFEISGVSPVPGKNKKFLTTPMVERTEFPGPDRYDVSDHVYTTNSQVIKVDPENLCFSLQDPASGKGLTTICTDNLRQEYKTLTIDPFQTESVYGLGQYPGYLGASDGDWIGRVWEPGPMGNMTKFKDGGGPSYSQFPIMYALGKSGENYALFLDHPYKQRWDFSRPNQWWKLDTWGDEIRGYLIGGNDLSELRQRYMDLVGKPPVPPKKVFGLWMSEFGYDNWGEIDSNLKGLRKHGFPVDGFVLDIQWYGNEFGKPETSKMGSLTWDEENFPNPQQKINDLKAQGIELMLIEQSYIHKPLREHEMMASRGFLARDFPGGPPSYIDYNPWWGKGGLIDWSNPDARVFWHNEKRQRVVDMGIRFHWTDLGEPEMYRPWSVYAGFWPGKHRHGDIHNLFNLLWAQGISDGYRKNNPDDRHFILARAGSPGIQRFGTGMWGGDDGANMWHLSMHMNRHLHMAFSGIDYYGSDAGGYFTWNTGGDRNEIYTQWFAFSAMVDFPLRPHVWNLSNNIPTSPAWAGHRASNRENLHLRYRLLPYYYSLAHRAHRWAEPIVAPMVTYYQHDKNVRKAGHQFFIGKNLLAAGIASHGEKLRNVYLPAGRWIDWYTNEFVNSKGEYIQAPTWREGNFRLPFYAKAGAIIPMAKVDRETMNLDGLRLDGTTNSDLHLRVFSDQLETQFDLFEDDGRTKGYERGEVRVTNLWQQRKGNTAHVVIRAASGNYQGALSERNNVVELVADISTASKVRVMGEIAQEVFSVKEFDSHQGACFFNLGENIVLAKSGVRPVTSEVSFDFELQ